MPKELKESILKTIGNRFYIWFLTLGVVVISAVWLQQMEVATLLWVRVTGGIAVLPLAGILRVVVRTKKDKTDDESKLQRQESRQNYRLKKAESKRTYKIRMKELELQIIEAKKIK